MLSRVLRRVRVPEVYISLVDGIMNVCKYVNKRRGGKRGEGLAGHPCGIWETLEEAGR